MAIVRKLNHVLFLLCNGRWSYRSDDEFPKSEVTSKHEMHGKMNIPTF